MSRGMFCVQCALEMAEGRWSTLAGIPELIDGECPECGGTRGIASEAGELVSAEANA